MPDISPNLTQYEYEALYNTRRGHNLADGHAHQYQTESQTKIVEQLNQIFHYAESTSQAKIEREFLGSFFKIARQPTASTKQNTLLCYSASTVIEIAANLIKKRGWVTGVVTPTFDNIPFILQRVGVQTVAIEEQIVFSESKIVSLKLKGIKALFLVIPNNPTGKHIDFARFNEIVEFCSQNNVVLIVDFCFRFFVNPLLEWEQYLCAEKAKISYIFIEDTGKTWPSLDLKVGLLTVSDDLLPETKRIHNDFLLNVSPFILELLRRYLDDSIEHGLNNSIQNIVQSNRAYLREMLSSSFIRPANLTSLISVEWLTIEDEYSGDYIVDTLKNVGVYLLPGKNFFWSNPAQGDKFVRLALMRDPKVFRMAINQLVKTLGESNHNR